MPNRSKHPALAESLSFAPTRGTIIEIHLFHNNLFHICIFLSFAPTGQEAWKHNAEEKAVKLDKVKYEGRANFAPDTIFFSCWGLYMPSMHIPHTTHLGPAFPAKDGLKSIEISELRR